MKEKGLIRRYGFYTTRYVKANDDKDAEDKAINLVKKEVSKIFIKDKEEPAFIFVEETNELESFGDEMVPGKGFSLYEEKKRSNRTLRMLKKS